MKNKINSIIAIAGVTVITLVILSQITSFRKTPSNVFGSDTTVGLTATFSQSGQATSTAKKYYSGTTTTSGNSIYAICENCEANPSDVIFKINKSNETENIIYFSSTADGASIIKFQNVQSIHMDVSYDINVSLYSSLDGVNYSYESSKKITTADGDISISKRYFKLHCLSDGLTSRRNITNIVLTYDCDPNYVEPTKKYDKAGVYSAQFGTVTKYDLVLTLNEDFSGKYQFKKSSSSTYNDTYIIFAIDSTDSNKLLCYQDPNKTSTGVSTSGNYNMFISGITVCNIAMGTTTATFDTYYSTGGNGTSRTLTKQ